MAMVRIVCAQDNLAVAEAEKTALSEELQMARAAMEEAGQRGETSPLAPRRAGATPHRCECSLAAVRSGV